MEICRPFWILWSSFYFWPKSLLFEITCRGNLCKKNAKERVCEFSDAPSTRRCPEPPPSWTYSCCAYSYSSLYILFLLVVQTLTPCIYCYPSYILSLLVVYILTPCINYYPSSYILLLTTTITSYILLLLLVHTPCHTYSYSLSYILLLLVVHTLTQVPSKPSTAVSNSLLPLSKTTQSPSKIISQGPDHQVTFLISNSPVSFSRSPILNGKLT